MNLVALFCHVDDFCHAFDAAWLGHQLTTGHRRRRRAGRLCLSEIMTLLIWLRSISPITGISKPSTWIMSVSTYAMRFRG